MEAAGDAIYCALGKAVVLFQWLENQLRLVAGFAISPKTAGFAVPEAHPRKFHQLVSLTAREVHAFANRYGGDIAAEFLQQFPDIFDRCQGLGRRRNELLHSTYVHIESSGELLAMVRSNARVDKTGNLVRSQEDLSPSSFDSFLHDVAVTGFELGIIHRQLIAWYRP